MSKHLLSPLEFRNAVYLDFEGEGRKKDNLLPKPHMAGVFYPNKTGSGGKYESFFYKSLWQPAANGVRRAECLEFEKHFERIAAALEQEQSHLVFWSIHENLVLETFLPAKIYTRIEPYLYNLHPATKKYLNRRRAFGLKGTAKGKTLEECFAALRTKRKPYPPFPLGAAEACRRIDTACTAHKKWRKFSDKQKSYVKDLVQYNEGDCRSTWIIAKRVGNYFASISQRRRVRQHSFDLFIRAKLRRYQRVVEKVMSELKELALREIGRNVVNFQNNRLKVTVANAL